MGLQDLNQGLKEGSGDRPPGWSFEEHGPSIQGTVVDGGKFQGTVYMSNPPIPETWPGGNPKYTFYLVLQTELRSPAIQDHDGRWTVTLNSNRYTAANDALKAAGCEARGFEEGGQFGLRFVGERPNKSGQAKYKAYEAFYSPPAVSRGWGPGAQQAPPAAVPTPMQQPMVQPAPPVNPIGPGSYQGYGAGHQAPPGQYPTQLPQGPAPGAVAAQAWGSTPPQPAQQPAQAAPQGPAAWPQPQAQPAQQAAPQPEPQQGQPTPWPAAPRQLA